MTKSKEEIELAKNLIKNAKENADKIAAEKGDSHPKTLDARKYVEELKEVHK